jgi:hypothetical protein
MATESARLVERDRHLSDASHRNYMKNRTIDVKPERSPWLLFLALFFATAFLYLRTFLLPATPFIAFGDEVHYFLHAVRMLHGELPYRDFFTFVFPGADVLYAGVFRVFGVHQGVAQGLIVLLGLLLACAVTWVSSSILRGRLVLLPGLLFLTFDFTGALDATHHWWSTLFVLAAMAVLLDGRDHRRVVAAGGLCGIAALFTQTEGGLSLIAVSVYLVLTHRKVGGRSSTLREVALLIAPFVVVIGSVIGYFAWKIGLRTILYWTIYFPLAYFSTIPAHTPGAYFLRIPAVHGLGDLFSAAPFFVVHLVVPLSYVFCFVRLIRRKRDIEPLMWERVFLITLIGFATFLSVANAATFLRLCVIAPPTLILTVWYFGGDSKRERWIRGALWTMGFVFLISLSISRQIHARSYLDLPTGRVAFLVPSQYDRVQWLAARTHPGDTFFNDPYVAFALSLNSPGPIDYVLPSEFTRPEQVDALLKSMTAHQTRFLYLYPEMYGQTRVGDNLGPLREFVAKNYHLAKSDSTGQMWERN